MSQCPPNCVNRCCWNAKQRAHALQACADAGLDLGSVGVADRALVAYARAAIAEGRFEPWRKAFAEGQRRRSGADLDGLSG